MRLLLVELDRFRSRRAIVLMLAAAALLVGALAASTIYETRPVSAADLAQAQAQAQTDAERPRVQRDLERCEANPRRFLGPGVEPEQCAEVILPRVDWYLERPQLSLALEGSDTGLASLLIMVALLIVVGTTFAGADWASGSVSNQLLFEPRRVKVWLAKAAAVFLATLVAALVILAAFWIALYLTAESRGITTKPGVLEDIRWTMVLGTLLAAGAALGGYALTMLVRHTVGALGIVFAYAVGGEAVTAALPIEGAGRWSLANNVFAFVRDGHRYYDPSIQCGPRGMCNQMARLELIEGAVYLGVLLLVVLVLSVLSFRRRDVP